MGNACFSLEAAHMIWHLCGLKKKCPLQSQALEHVVPSFGCYLGRFRWHSLTGESMPLERGSEIKSLPYFQVTLSAFSLSLKM